MGVPGLFKHFANECPECVTDHSNKQPSQRQVHVLALDLNAIFHPCVSEIMADYLPPEPQSLICPEPPLKTGKPSDKQFFALICKKISEIVTVFRPTQQLILCIDGVAGAAKQHQQRQRRFRSVQERSLEQVNIFDKNAISCGTSWMNALSKYIHIFCQRQKAGEWKTLRVIFSNEKIAGEGEQKIMKHIRELKAQNSTNVMIFSPDADVILLALSLHAFKQTYVIRDAFNKPGYYSIVDVTLLKSFVVKTLAPQLFIAKGAQTPDARAMIEDFVYCMSFAGNDFLPVTNAMQIHHNSMFVISDTMKQTYETTGATMLTPSVRGINGGSISHWVELLANYEDVFLSNISADKGFQSIEDYKKDWYSRKLGDNFEQKLSGICEAYLKTTLFVLRYYLFGMPDWSWVYPVCYSPFMRDVAAFLSRSSFAVGSLSFNLNRPLSPLEQLLSVLPPQSRKLLPTSLQEVFDSKMIRNLCPSFVALDGEDKEKDYEHIVLVPLITASIVRQLFSEAQARLSDADLKLNVPGKLMIY